MDQKMKPHVIRRQVEICPVCECWDCFRKYNGRSVVDKATGLRRIYGFCRACGAKLVLLYTVG